jgi:hypothetical protein
MSNSGITEISVQSDWLAALKLVAYSKPILRGRFFAGFVPSVAIPDHPDRLTVLQEHTAWGIGDHTVGVSRGWS